LDEIFFLKGKSERKKFEIGPWKTMKKLYSTLLERRKLLEKLIREWVEKKGKE